MPASSVLGVVERQDLGAARLALDRQQLRARLAVDLAEGDRPGRLDEEPLLGAELAPLGGEPDADRVVGAAVEDHQVVAAVAVEVDGA